MRVAATIAAKAAGLPPALILAMIVVESRERWWAYRAEPKYRWFWSIADSAPFRRVTDAEIVSETAPSDFTHYPLLSSKDTEWWGQQASWGPLQVMGAVARELGFTGDFPQLCSGVGINLGCLHLQNLHRRFSVTHDWPGVIAAYNAGSPRQDTQGRFVNQDYVDKVMKHWKLNERR